MIDVSNKLVPHSLEAEQALLGLLLVACDKFIDLPEKFSQNMFYLPEHQMIFWAISKLYKEFNGKVETIIVCNYLRQISRTDGYANNLEFVGGGDYMVNLENSVLPTANITNYASIIAENYVLRSMINIGNEIIESGYATHGLDIDSLIYQAMNKLEPLLTSESIARSNSEIAQNLLEKIHSKTPIVDVIPCGYQDLDNMEVFYRHGYTIIGGRPGMGKTAFTLNLAMNMSKTHRVMFYSLEMSHERILFRIMTIKSKLNAELMKGHKLTPNDFDKLIDTMDFIRDNNDRLIIETAKNVIDEIENELKRRQKNPTKQVDVIIIDYVELLKINSGVTKNRTNDLRMKIIEISQRLMLLKQKYPVCIILISQVNRDSESRANKRPTASNLKESDNLVSDADSILMLYREDYYNKHTADYEPTNMLEVLVEKNRSGDTGTVNLYYDLPTQEIISINKNWNHGDFSYNKAGDR